MSVREIRRYIRHILRDQSTRRMSFEQVKAQLGVKASARTIRRELRCVGYRHCIACLRPYISRKQAKKRLDFALSHRWQGMSDQAAHGTNGKVRGDQRKVIWSDEAIFKVEKCRRIQVTHYVDEKRCTNYMWSVYRSGRFLVMIQGGIGQDYKSELVFLEKLPSRK